MEYRALGGWRPAAAVLFFHAAWISAFLASGHDPIEFAHLGHQFVTRANTSQVISARAHDPHVTELVGNDGQFAYYMAADPVHARDYVDDPSYRLGRFLYPLLARITALGNPGWVPVTLILVNLLAVAGATLVVGGWLARRGVNSWFAVVFGLFPGAILCLRFDLGDPVAYALVAVAVCLFDFGPSPRWLWAAAAFACAALSRETAVLFALGYLVAMIALPPLDGHRRRRQAVGLLAIAPGPLLLVKAALTGWTGHLGQGLGLELPFLAILSPQVANCSRDCGIGNPAHIWAEALLVLLPALIICALAAIHVARYGWSAPVLNLFGNVLLFYVFVNREAFLGLTISFRFTLSVALAALFCIPALRQLGPRAHSAARIAAAVWMASAPVLLLRSMEIISGL